MIKANHPLIIISGIVGMSMLTLMPFYLKYKVNKRDGELDPSKSFL